MAAGAVVGTNWIYPALAVIGIVGSSVVWGRLLKGQPQARDPRLLYIYLSALAGALLGAKAAYLFAEGWMLLPRFSAEPELVLRHWLTGKSITGGLLGGYGAVELVKRLTGYRHATGDLFAVIAPLGLVLGRAGCYFTGCCPGQPMASAWYTVTDAAGVSRWPSVPVELGFNLLFALFAFLCWRSGRFRGQLFHLYLIAYGLFRFGHEFFRDTPRIVFDLSGYHIVAGAVAVLGFWRYVQRARAERSAQKGF